MVLGVILVVLGVVLVVLGVVLRQCSEQTVFGRMFRANTAYNTVGGTKDSLPRGFLGITRV